MNQLKMCKCAVTSEFCASVLGLDFIILPTHQFLHQSFSQHSRAGKDDLKIYATVRICI